MNFNCIKKYYVYYITKILIFFVSALTPQFKISKSVTGCNLPPMMKCYIESTNNTHTHTYIKQNWRKRLQNKKSEKKSHLHYIYLKNDKINLQHQNMNLKREMWNYKICFLISLNYIQLEYNVFAKHDEKGSQAIKQLYNAFKLKNNIYKKIKLPSYWLCFWTYADVIDLGANQIEPA